MDLEFNIKIFLCKNNYQPNYLWRAPNYLNGFLINLPDYNETTMRDFQNIMLKYCEIGYFKSEKGISNLPNYRLTEKGYLDIIVN